MGTVRTKTGNLSFAKYQVQRAILENVLESNYTQEDRKAALDLFRGCAFCGSIDAPRNDHLVPVIKRGDFVPKNVVPACQKCDDSKGASDFREWMRNGTSPGSLRARGRSEAEIEERIKIIQEFMSGYHPKTEEEIFGPLSNQYREILKKMDALIGDSQKLIKSLNSIQKPRLAGGDSEGRRSSKPNGRMADKARQLALDQYIGPARSRGDREIVITSEELHSRLALRDQYPNICQALGGRKLQQMAHVIVRVDGPNPSSTTRFTYQLL